MERAVRRITQQTGLVTLCIWLLAAALLSAAAGAQSGQPKASEVADQLGFRGYYLEDGVDADSQIDAIELAGAAINEVGAPIYMVVLTDEPSEGGDVFGRDVIEQMPVDGSVLVISDEYVNAVSTVYTDAEVGEALDAANESVGQGYAVGWTAFATQLDTADPTPDAADNPGQAQVPAPQGNDTSSSADSSGGGGGFIIFLIVLIAIGAVIWLFLRRGKKKNNAHQGELVDEARGEVQALIGDISTEIVELEPTVAISGNADAEKHFSDANVGFLDAQRKLEAAKTLNQLTEVSQDLTQVRWNLDAAAALLDGKKVPEVPGQIGRVCFFDPSHRNVVETAEIATNGQTVEVPVCEGCASKLEKGEMPQTRTINAGGRAIPAPQAPTSHGGGGMKDLGQGSISLPGRKGGGGFDFSDTMGDVLDSVTRSGGSRSRSRSGGGMGGGMGGVLDGVLGGVLGSRSRSGGTSGGSQSSRSRSTGSRQDADGLKRGAGLPSGPSGRSSNSPVRKPSSSGSSPSSASRSRSNSGSTSSAPKPSNEVTGRARRRRK
jgi:preprotein translocase subunit YajC